MSWQILQGPLFHVGGYYISFLGLVAFVAFFSAGLIVARVLQSGVVRRFFSRFKIDNNFIAIVTTILSLAALVFFTITAVNAAGIPLAWNQPLPGFSLSLTQIFLLVALLIAVFWVSSRTKRFFSIVFWPTAVSIALCSTRFPKSSPTSCSSWAFSLCSKTRVFTWPL